jgi:hypothetical protein
MHCIGRCIEDCVLCIPTTADTYVIVRGDRWCVRTHRAADTEHGAAVTFMLMLQLLAV